MAKEVSMIFCMTDGESDHMHTRINSHFITPTNWCVKEQFRSFEPRGFE
jgi:hypothetical protein